LFWVRNKVFRTAGTMFRPAVTVLRLPQDAFRSAMTVLRLRRDAFRAPVTVLCLLRDAFRPARTGFRSPLASRRAPVHSPPHP
jgi:hypothetical protein